VQKLAAEAGPLLNDRLQALQQKVRADLGLPEASAGGSSAAAPPRPAASATKPASK
jgi:hypothetical protein